MNKIVINLCYGGFGLSREGMELYEKYKKGSTEIYHSAIFKDEKPKRAWKNAEDPARHDPTLVRVVEELGDKASSDVSNPTVIRITSNLYRIEEYDGFESLHTPETDAESYIQIKHVKPKIKHPKQIL